MLARGLVERGHRSLLAAPRGSAIQRAAVAAGLPATGLPMKGEFDPASIFGIAGILREAPVDLLHYHTSHAVTLGTLATLIAGRRPAVLTRRVSFSLRRNPFARFKYTFRVDHLIAVADSVRWVMIAEGIAPDRVSVIHSGIDLARFSAPRDRVSIDRELGLPPDAFLVGCVGHLARHKGHGTLLDAAAHVAGALPQLRLLLIGEGSERARLEARASAEPLAGRVLFAGFRDDVPRLVAALDLLVLPSISGEGSPAVIKEAMACGVPVVATDLEGVREIVEDGRDALLVPVGDPDRLAAAIQRAASDADLRRGLAEAGRVRVKEYSSDRMVERTLEVYGQVLGKLEARTGRA
jgi:glycosyltransferase involved in cell wall biosynthesis